MKKITLLLVFCLALSCVVLPTVAFAQSEGAQATLSEETFAPTTNSANALNITAREAVAMSADGRVLFEKNGTEKRPIASMTKIMTLICIYDAVDEGKISLDDDVVVSQRAASMGGSQVFLDEHATYKAEQLVKSIIVCSANDSCVAMAEHICGSVESFVEKMNNKAEALSLQATHFENCTGLPHVSQFSCALDAATMLRELIKHPHYFQCANIWMEDFAHPGGRVTGMTNTNKLVRFYEGCDGGKTGFTNEAMHCLAATAKRGETRIISVVVGAPDSKTRFKEVSDMFNYAFANYQNKVYLQASEHISDVTVSGGKTDCKIVASSPLCYFGKKGEEGFTVQTEIESNLRAPIAEGQKVGVAKLVAPDGTVVGEVELVAETSVQRKSFGDYIREICG